MTATDRPTLEEAGSAAFGQRSAFLPADDERQIQRLCLIYGMASDLGDVEAIVGLFTEDGLWDGTSVRMPRARGHEELRAHFTAECPDGLRQIHVIEQPLVTPGASDDEAHGLVIFQAMRATEGIKAPSAAYGMHQDLYRRVDGTWLIAERIIHLRVVQ